MRLSSMSLPTVRVNTYFVNKNEKSFVDPISKIFIVSEAMFGLNRMPLIGRGQLICVFLTFAIFLFINVVVIYMTVKSFVLVSVNFIVVALISQNIISSLLSFTRCKWMLSYYDELRRFDSETGCRPKVSNGSICNIVLAALFCIFTVLLLVIPFPNDVCRCSPQQLIPLHVIYVLELFYVGHLLNLLTPRLKLINYYIKSSLSSIQSEPNTILKEYVYFKSFNSNIMPRASMMKLMDLYLIVVDAYDYLIEAIKWQFLFNIISTFMAVLGFLYMYTWNAIHSGQYLTDGAEIQLGVVFILMAPLFAPCTFADSVHSEVKKLRELLASRLYENKLDKSGRSVARALLAFTETRDLSFRLLRMLNIDISLPFKFVGLLVTYLIILLQFEKVIHP